MIKIFLDSCDINLIKEFEPRVQGFTTNPSLARKAGVTDYEKFCKEVLIVVKGKPVSFEVFADEFDEMERQARIISSWGGNVYVKIPCQTTRGEYCRNIIERLSNDGIKVNVTAATEADHVVYIRNKSPMIFSMFCGRIADIGIDPIKSIQEVAGRYSNGNAELLWASPREVLNIYQAEEALADIITVTPELLTKYWKMKGKDLNELSLETVKMFYNDAKEAGYTL